MLSGVISKREIFLPSLESFLEKYPEESNYLREEIKKGRVEIVGPTVYPVKSPDRRWGKSYSAVSLSTIRQSMVVEDKRKRFLRQDLPRLLTKECASLLSEARSSTRKG